MIRGITIQLLVKRKTGTDEFNNPVFEEQPEDVENVLVAPLSDSEVLDTLSLTGRRAIYQLAIPKGDTHQWENQRVRFFGQTWRVVGKPQKGIDHLMPLDWNTRIRVESVDG